MAITIAPQATDLGTLMASVGTILTFAARTVPVTIQPQDVTEYYGEIPKPRYTGNSCIWYRPVDDQPLVNMGAARRGHYYELILEVIVGTRLAIDIANDDSGWSRNAGRGHFIMRKVVNDFLQDMMLFGAYDPVTQKPTAGVLTVATVQRLHPPSGWVKKATLGDPSWGFSNMFFKIPLVDLLTVPTAGNT